VKKLISLLLCIVLISGCDKQLNNSQPDKADAKTANQVSPSPSPNPTPIPSPLPLPEEQFSIPESSGSGISNTRIGIGIAAFLIVLGILWKFSCCCFGDKKSGKPASIPKHLRPNMNTKKDNPHNPFEFLPNPASEGDDNAPPFGNNGNLNGVSFQGSIPHL
jgi:hypothetical protein